MTKPNSDFQKHTLNLFRGDFEKLRVLYPNLESSLVLRTILRKHITEVEGGKETVEIKID